MYVAFRGQGAVWGRHGLMYQVMLDKVTQRLVAIKMQPLRATPVAMRELTVLLTLSR